jgi:hypothetical protein
MNRPPAPEFREVTRVGRMWAFTVYVGDQRTRYRSDLEGYGLYRFHKPRTGPSTWKAVEWCPSTYRWPLQRDKLDDALRSIFQRMEQP